MYHNMTPSPLPPPSSASQGNGKFQDLSLTYGGLELVVISLQLLLGLSLSGGGLHLPDFQTSSLASQKVERVSLSALAAATRFLHSLVCDGVNYF